MRLLLNTLLVTFSLLLVSCGSVSVSRPLGSALTQHSQIYVVRHDKSDRDIDQYVADAFTRRAYQVKTGTQAEMPANTTHYVTYVDRWHWDMAMYLLTLDIVVHDRKSGLPVGAGSYRNATFHGFPSPPKTADRIVGQILGEKEE